MRCQSCSKFVSFDAEQEPDDVEVEVDATTGDLSGSCRITNTCADCGTELTSAELELELTPDLTETKGRGKQRKTVVLSRGSQSSYEAWRAEVDPDAAGAWKFEVEVEGAERAERSEGSGRYSKRFYGAEVTVMVTATKVKGGDVETWSGPLYGEVQASGMDEC